MALEIPYCSYTLKNYLIFGIILLAVGAWFGNDGYNKNSKYYQEQMSKNNGQPTLDLRINQVTPFFALACAAYCLTSLVRLRKRRVVADETQLSIDGKLTIPYSSISKLDKRKFQDKGVFYLYYHNNSNEEHVVKFSDKHYDKLGLLIDKILEQAQGSSSTPSKPDEPVTESN